MVTTNKFLGTLICLLAALTVKAFSLTTPPLALAAGTTLPFGTKAQSPPNGTKQPLLSAQPLLFWRWSQQPDMLNVFGMIHGEAIFSAADFGFQ
jgi:hypothetical protein